MRLVARGLILVWLSFGPCTRANGDGGTVRLSAQQGGYRITVFSAPSPLRTGPVDISVLVQNAATGEFLVDGSVTVRMTKIGQPALEYPATRQAATNKLLHAAQFEVPLAGQWHLEVRVEGSQGVAVVGCELEAAGPAPRWLEMWPWICWPALVIALYAFGKRRAVENTTSRCNLV
jgi:hypothetical protein